METYFVGRVFDKKRIGMRLETKPSENIIFEWFLTETCFYLLEY